MTDSWPRLRRSIPTPKRQQANLGDVAEAEIIAPHQWEDRTSSDGVPIKVARLGRSALVRRAA